MPRRKLTYGDTPWDNMSREKLFIELARLHQAASSARSCLRIMRYGDPHSPYWGDRGVGGRALLMLEESLHYEIGYSDQQREIFWKGFFRNAMDLLFKHPAIRDGYNWRVCGPCEHWVGNQLGKPPASECMRCKGPVRPIKWTDFATFFKKPAPKQEPQSE